jgi:hypothetical protein
MQYETEMFYSIVALVLLERMEVSRGIDSFRWNAVSVLAMGISLTVCTALITGSVSFIAVLVLIQEAS